MTVINSTAGKRILELCNGGTRVTVKSSNGSADIIYKSIQKLEQYDPQAAVRGDFLRSGK